MRLRKLIFLTMIVLLLVALGGCSKEESPAAAGEEKSTDMEQGDSVVKRAEKTGAPYHDHYAINESQVNLRAYRHGNTDKQGPLTAKKLKIGVFSKPQNITTYSVGDSWSDWLLWLVFDKLREPSPYSLIQKNWLAEEVKSVSDDNRVWEVRLKKGIKWHDGTELTADDLKFTYEYYRDAGISNRWTHHTFRMPNMVEVEKIGDYTVRITSQYPMPNYDRVTAADLAIIQKKQWENVKNPKTFMEIPIGTGPYKVVDFEPGEFYRLKANEDYHMGKPLVDELEVVVIDDLQVLFTSLKSGQVDAAVRVIPPELMDQWVNSDDMKVVETPSFWGVWAQFNYKKGFLTDPELRQAVSLAIDPDDIKRLVMLGYGKSGLHGWPHPDAPWTHPDIEQPYDPAKAARIFDARGYKDVDGDGLREDKEGNQMTWRIVLPGGHPQYVRAGELIGKQLGEVGIRCEVKSYDSATLSEIKYKSMNYDISVGEITPHGIADQDMLIIFQTAEFIKKTDSLGYDPEIAKIIADKWNNAKTRAERFAAAGELEKYNNTYPRYRPLWFPPGLWAYRWESYDNYVVAVGYGIFHKYSFLPHELSEDIVMKYGEK